MRVLKGIVLEADDQPLALTLELEEEAREGDEWVRRRARISSEAATGRPRFHYGAAITLRHRLPAAPTYAAMDLREDDNATDGDALYTDGTLFHGPSFRGVRRVLHATPERLALRCDVPPVPEVTQGQFPVGAFNPFVADVQFQGLVVWARWFRHAASLPVGAARSEQYRPLRFGETYYVSVEIESSTPHELVGTTVVHDAAGAVHAQVVGARLALSERLNALFQSAPSTAPTSATPPEPVVTT